MKTAINPKSNSPIPFPKLMVSKNTGRVVLFETPTKGVVVYTGKMTYLLSVGESASDWVPEQFEDYHGTVTLSSD